MTLTRVTTIWINHVSRAAITARVVGARLPPSGSIVTSTRVTPTSSPGTPMSAVPRDVTANRVLGAGVSRSALKPQLVDPIGRGGWEVLDDQLAPAAGDAQSGAADTGHDHARARAGGSEHPVADRDHGQRKRHNEGAGDRRRPEANRHRKHPARSPAHPPVRSRARRLGLGADLLHHAPPQRSADLVARGRKRERVEDRFQRRDLVAADRAALQVARERRARRRARARRARKAPRRCRSRARRRSDTRSFMARPRRARRARSATCSARGAYDP